MTGTYRKGCTAVILLVLCGLSFVRPDEFAKLLFEDLLFDYMRLVLPVYNNSRTLQVRVHLRLSQLLAVVERDQIMKTSVWVRQEWYDGRLRWNPRHYGGIEYIYVPPQLLWTPDIVLYNNADGNYEITMQTKATVYHTGKVVWEPPAIYKSMCEINIEWFPFDEQVCILKFGSWSYDGYQVDLIHWRHNHVNITRSKRNETVWVVDHAIELGEYYPSVEWDIIAVPANRHVVTYPCCPAPFVDITYYLHIRRKTLFYTVNLLVPITAISFLAVGVFYLPGDSGEKIVLCISIFFSLTIFFLLLIELIPATSLAIPLIGQYLLFILATVSASVIITIMTMHVHCHPQNSFRKMPAWLRDLFLVRLPHYLWLQPLHRAGRKDSYNIDYMLALVNRMRAAGGENGDVDLLENVTSEVAEEVLNNANSVYAEPHPSMSIRYKNRPSIHLRRQLYSRGQQRAERLSLSQELRQRLEYTSAGILFIAARIKQKAFQREVADEWKYLSMVIDRCFMVVFCVVVAAGFVIILRAPSLRDHRLPLEINPWNTMAESLASVHKEKNVPGT